MNHLVLKILKKMGHTFEQFLADSRLKETNNLRKNQRKKVCGQPGKSMTSKSDLSDKEYINEPSTSLTSKKLLFLVFLKMIL